MSPRCARIRYLPWLTALFLTVAMADEGGGPLYFSDETLQSRYEGLLTELRCLVCQNQSLIDSDASLAEDLRQQVYDMLEEGAADSEITDFLVQRYGDFVLYRPPLRRSTWLLWYAPVLMLLVAVLIVSRIWRRAGTMKEKQVQSG